MKTITEETIQVEETNHLNNQTEINEAAISTPKAQTFMWLVGLFGLLALLGAFWLDNSALSLITQPDPAELFSFFCLLITAIVCRHFYFTSAGNSYIALSMLICQAAFIIYSSVPAAIIGAVAALWAEFLVTKRGLAFGMRTAGMYVLCAIAARWVYQVVGGQAIVGDIDLLVIGQVLAGFIAFQLVYNAVLIITNQVQEQDFSLFVQKRLIEISLLNLAMLPGAMLLAVLKAQIGPGAVLLGCFCIAIVSLILRQSSTKGQDGEVQLRQVQNLNYRLATQSQRQKTLGVTINQTLDSFLQLVREYAGISQEQQTAVVEITATIEQLSRTASQIAGSADNVAEAAEQAIEAAEHGQEAVNATITALDEVREKVEETDNKIIDLNKKSERIGEIVTTINAIAGEIRLLALNATIEASGAGPFGRRFAVVAAEVNELADRSRQASQEIREIIVEIQQATSSSMTVTKEGLQRVEHSVTLARQSSQINLEIINVVERTAQQAAAISLATQQQRSASEQVVTSVHDVAITISQNAEKINSVSGSSLELQRIARDLQSEEN